MASKQIIVKTNFPEFSGQIRRAQKVLPNSILAYGMNAVLTEIGAVAIQDFMIQTKGIKGAVTASTDKNKLTTRTGRLSRSLIGALAFSVASLPLTVPSAVRGAVRAGKTIKTAPTNEGIQKVHVTGSRIIGIKSTTVPYAAAHEKGARYSVDVTPRMRKWAWFAYFETGGQIDFYRNLALTKKTRLNIHIPARPYLQPAANKVILGRRADEIFKAAIEAGMLDLGIGDI